MLNEFRRDPISGDWVLFDTGRKKNHIHETIPFHQPAGECFFEDPVKSNNQTPTAVYLNGSPITWSPEAKWTTMAIPNKFPTLTPGVCKDPHLDGLFEIADAHGFHELIITKDHDRNFSNFTDAEVSDILLAYLDRYKMMTQDGCGQYITIFHNKGPAAGATIYHNHSQIISLPVIPPGIQRSLKGAEDYYSRSRQMAHSSLIEWESKEKKRIVYENESFVAFCPFVSKQPYQIKLFPKHSSPRFESISDTDRTYLANALNMVLKKVIRGLNDADFNFYIHTAPAKPSSISYDTYCWHIEIIPRVKIVGGLELGTDVFANEIDPDEAAELFRSTSI